MATDNPDGKIETLFPGEELYQSSSNTVLKPKLQYFGHLMPKADSWEKPLMLGKIKGRRRRGSRG